MGGIYGGKQTTWIRTDRYKKQPERVHEIQAKVLGATEKALLCEVNGKTHWMPRSQIRKEKERLDNGRQIVILNECNKVGDEGVLLLPEWLVTAKELW